MVHVGSHHGNRFRAGLHSVKEAFCCLTFHCSSKHHPYLRGKRDLTFCSAYIELLLNIKKESVGSFFELEVKLRIFLFRKNISCALGKLDSRLKSIHENSLRGGLLIEGKIPVHKAPAKNIRVPYHKALIQALPSQLNLSFAYIKKIQHSFFIPGLFVVIQKYHDKEQGIVKHVRVINLRFRIKEYTCSHPSVLLG